MAIASTIKRGVINLDSAGTFTLEAAVASKRLVVYHVTVISDAAISVTFKSDTTAITGPIPVGANGGFSDGHGEGLFETAAGEKLDATLTGTCPAVGGFYSYRELD